MPIANGASESLHPLLLWAQRDAIVYLTIDVDMEIEDLSFTSNSVHCKGVGGPEKQKYECTVELNGEIDPEDWRRLGSHRRIELVLTKKEKGWWPRLTKEKLKAAWIKTDFQKWKDEDEESEHEEGSNPAQDFDLNAMMSKMGGGDVGAMGGMGGMGGMNLGDFGEHDSDNEDLPDLEDGDEEEDGGDKKPETTTTTKDAAATVEEVGHEEQPTTSGEALVA